MAVGEARANNKRDSAAPLDNAQYSRPGLVAATSLLFGPALLVFAPSLLGLTAFVAALCAPSWNRARPSRKSGVYAWLIAALCLWGVGRMILAPLPPTQEILAMLSVMAIVLAGMLVGGEVRRGVDRALVTRAAMAGIGVAGALLAVDAGMGWFLLQQVSGTAEGLGRDASLQEPARAFAYVAISALLPLGFAGAGMCLRLGLVGLMAAFGIVLAFGALTVFTQHWLGLAAWALGLIILICGYLRPEWTFSVVAQIGAIGIALSPWWLAPLGGLLAQWLQKTLPADAEFAWVGRVQSWGYAAKLIAKKPLHGWGPGASASFDQTYSLGGYPIAYFSGHPHSAALQLWVEMGGVGAALACAGLAAFGRRNGAALAKDSAASAAASSVLAIGITLACLDSDFWSLSLWTALALCVVITRLFRDAP